MLGILIIAFATLVYDELIIINKWKLNENVKLRIINRGEEDMKKIKELELEYVRESTFEDNFSPPENVIIEHLNQYEDIN